ncbi:MAG TPA: DarT ssDNA thymidine ADP-ribosyltransferase family protein [Polyangiales bacterium]|nr:DarT ssDNA thymidine ADP-ribosyltransferase family protein [Polyangiales bacterium]
MKVDRAQLEEHVRRWSQHSLHGDAPWIPRYLYHFTDVTNAAAILRSGELLSREEAKRRSTKFHDNASQQVIAATRPTHRDFARLYFRPRTPTQFHNEGIRPLSERKFDHAHCPVPVFLVFKLVETLMLDGLLFSSGNMAAAHVEFGDEASLFRQIPFDLVYHEGPIDDTLRARGVIHHRHAEVLAPKALGLETLASIACRSTAERETLLHLLGADERQRWEHRIGVGRTRFFNRRGCFVEKVFLDHAQLLHVDFHIPNKWSLRVGFQLASNLSPTSWSWSSANWTDNQLRLNLRDIEPGVMTLNVEECLAYNSLIQPTDVPF